MHEITDATVEIRERRAHPYDEGGFYEVSVTLYADPKRPNINRMLNKARVHISDEIERWEEGVIEEDQLRRLRLSIDGCLASLTHANHKTSDNIKDDTSRALAHILNLPEHEQTTYKSKLDIASVQAHTRLRVTALR